MTIITRFAPSPTGDLHLGGARTALFNYALAKRHGGRFLLRIEDTDRERSSEDSARGIIEALSWLGLRWDGNVEFQSDNLDAHRTCLRALADRDLAYPAFETADELSAMRAAAGRSWRYEGPSRRMSAKEADLRVRSGEPHVWRLRLPDEGAITVKDEIRGDVVTDMGVISDPVIWRSSSDAPLYNFACAIDDMRSGVTHIIRGEEHLSNAAIQSAVRSALIASGAAPDAPDPVWAHLPIVTRGGKKMSKRDEVTADNGPVGVLSRRSMGWTSEGVLNHLALLGWSRPSPDLPEIFGIKDFVSEFSLGRVRKSPSNFDEKKARNVQKAWIRLIGPDVAAARASELSGMPITGDVARLATEKASDLISLSEMVRFVYEAPDPHLADPSAIEVVGRPAMERIAEAISADDVTWDDVLGAYGGDDPRAAAAAIRTCLTGRSVSPDIIASIRAIGSAAASGRVTSAIEAIWGPRPEM